jgi:ribosome maturation factor RimP
MSEVLEKVRTFLEPLLEGTDMFIVNMKIKPTNNIKIFLDADEGLSISKSAGINRKLHHLIEESGMFPEGDYSLEVSSPGVDEPLMSGRQYKKNIGRKVLVTLKDESEKTGTLKTVGEESLVLEIKEGKKKEIKEEEIPFANIKTTVVQVIF